MCSFDELWNGNDVRVRPNPQEILINVDLIGSTPIYFKYLNNWKKYIKRGDNEQFVRRSIRRYERFWLTLMNQLTTSNNYKLDEYEYEPPPDVHWIWMLHQLQTSNYSSYCIQRFGRTLPHRFCRTDSEQMTCRSRAAHAWQKTFPTEPFYLENKEICDKQTDKETNSNCVGGPTTSSWSVSATRLDHLLVLAEKDKEYLYRIDLPQFRDQTFQFSANFRYRQFLALKQLFPQWVPLCLPADVELMWRVHMTQPIQYLEDISRIFNNRCNQMFNKDYRVNSHVNNSRFINTSDVHLTYNTFSYERDGQIQIAILNENQFWSLNYPNDENAFFTDGTIPRLSAFLTETSSNYFGNHSTKNNRNSKCAGNFILKAFPSEEFENMGVENCELIFNNICVEELWTKQKMFKVKAILLGANSFQQQIIFEAKGHIGHIVSDPDKKVKTSKTNLHCLGKCKFDSRENRGMELQVYAGQGFGCFIKYRPITNKIFNPLQNMSIAKCSSLEDLSAVGSPNGVIQMKHKMVLPKVTYTDPKITLNYTIEVAERKPFQFTLDRNPGEIIGLPAYLDTYLHHVLIWQHAKADVEEGKDYFVARHGLKCKEACLAFGVEIVRNDLYNLCAVMLFHNNKQLVALAYTVDSGYLVNSSQVLETCPLTYDPQLGDKVMMVQTFSGEDLVVVARMVDGGNGSNKVLFRTYSSRTRHTQSIEMREDELQSFSNENVSVDLPTGRITITSHADDVPENIVWAFCVGCLYISSQRNPNNTSMSSSHSMLGLNTSSILKINSGGSVKSSSGHVSLGEGTGTDISSIGKKSRKKISLHQHRLNKKQNRRRKMSASFTFLLACGFHADGSILTNARPSSNVLYECDSSSNSKPFDKCNTRSDLDLSRGAGRLSSNLEQSLKVRDESNTTNYISDSAYNSFLSFNNAHQMDASRKNVECSKIPLCVCQSYNPSFNFNLRHSAYYDNAVFEKL